MHSIVRVLGWAIRIMICLYMHFIFLCFSSPLVKVLLFRFALGGFLHLQLGHLQSSCKYLPNPKLFTYKSPKSTVIHLREHLLSYLQVTC